MEYIVVILEDHLGRSQVQIHVLVDNYYSTLETDNKHTVDYGSRYDCLSRLAVWHKRSIPGSQRHRQLPASLKQAAGLPGRYILIDQTSYLCKNREHLNSV